MMRKQKGQSGENTGITGHSVLWNFRVFGVFRGERSFLRSLCSFAASSPIRVYWCESVVRTTV